MAFENRDFFGIEGPGICLDSPLSIWGKLKVSLGGSTKLFELTGVQAGWSATAYKDCINKGLTR
jgi:hypothetical protein